MRISDWSSDVCSSDLLRDGELREYDIHPEEFGFAMAGSQNLRVNDAAESRTRVLEALANTPGVARDIVAFNAGAAIYAARRAETLIAGTQIGRASRRERGCQYVSISVVAVQSKIINVDRPTTYTCGLKHCVTTLHLFTT